MNLLHIITKPLYHVVHPPLLLSVKVLTVEIKSKTGPNLPDIVPKPRSIDHSEGWPLLGPQPLPNIQTGCLGDRVSL